MDGDAGAPLTGLGNYKGVMLCNRPPDDASRARGGEGAGQPFKSTIAPTASEQLGLQPAKQPKPAASAEVKTRGPSAALRRHCQWIKELQQQVQDDKLQAEEGAHAEHQRKAKMAEVFKQQRDAIRQIKRERHRSDIEPRELEAIMRPAAGPKKTAPVEPRKPLWAMTEDERDGFQDEEAEALIQFAEGLDFEKYIDDLEFKQCLQVVRDRAKKLQREQDAFKDSLVREFNASADADEGEHSSYGGDFMSVGSRPGGADRYRSAGVDDRPDWDTSTACGDDRQSIGRGSQHAADQVFEANPQLKGVHSKVSMQRLLEKAQDQASSQGS